MFRKTLFASLLALAAAAGPALAEGANGSGDNGTLGYASARSGTGSVVGGGVVSMTGGGDNQSFAYVAPHAPQPGWIATLTGGSDNAEVAYQQTAPSVSSFARMATGGTRG